MTDQAPELLPCPDCGKPPGTKVGPPALARCVTDGCPGKSLGAKTIAEWNTRPTPAERPVPKVREALETIIKIANYGRKMLQGIDRINITPVTVESNKSAVDRFSTITQMAESALTARPSDARTVFPEDDWSERDKELADWFNALPCRDEEHWDALMRILCERPSDAAVAWRYRHKDTEGWSMLKNGRDPTEWLKQWPTIEYDIQPLYALPPDGPAREKETL